MSRKLPIALLVVAGAMLGVSFTSVRAADRQGQPANSSRVSAQAAEARAVLDQYCVGCHNTRLKTAGLALDALDVSNLQKNPVVWEKVVRKLRGGLMPPVGRPRPDA